MPEPNQIQDCLGLAARAGALQASADPKTKGAGDDALLTLSQLWAHHATLNDPDTIEDVRRSVTAAEKRTMLLTSPVKWLTDAQFAALPFHERILHTAASQVGVKEATGHNDGDVDKYLQAAGMGVGSKLAYCASGVYWCAIECGGDAKELPSRGKCAAVRNWRLWATEEGYRRSEPKRGMLFYWTNTVKGNEQGHTGFIVKCALGVITTIEFNSNGEGAREGNGVVRRVRTVAGLKKNERWGFIDLTAEKLDGTK